MSREPGHFTLLPGLHGTAGLFTDFEACAPAWAETRPLGYPSGVDSYAAAIEWAARELRQHAPTTLVAESFSTPVAITLAATMPKQVTRLVLVAGFACSPRRRWARTLPWRMGMSLCAPLFAFAGPWFGSRELARRFQGELAEVPRSILAQRMRAVLTVDVREQLARVRAPILYLRGSQDRWVGTRALSDVAAAVGDASQLTVRELPSNHFVLQNQPEAAWRCIAESCATPASS